MTCVIPDAKNGKNLWKGLTDPSALITQELLCLLKAWFSFSRQLREKIPLDFQSDVFSGLSESQLNPQVFAPLLCSVFIFLPR